MSSNDYQMRGSSMLIIGVLVGILHYYHVKSLYENDRHFSHLSSIEREMCFRSEMGLYYSFYKRIVTSHSFKDGLYKLTHDNLTEYPDTINALHKFNIYPEAMIGGLWRIYHLGVKTFGLNGKQCYMIHRGEGLPPVESCEGFGEPILFYLEVVWMFAGITAFVLYYFGSHLSGSQIGGCLTILSFFINHTESTRVQWTPPLRESFAYPFILLHCALISSILQDSRKTMPRPSFWKGLMSLFSSFVSLLFWQFSQFILTCEIAILIAIYAFGFIKRHCLSQILAWISAGFLLALVGLGGNSLLCFSFLSAILTSAWVLLICDGSVNSLGFAWTSVLKIISIIAFAIVLKLVFPSTGNDSHIVKIFLSKIFPHSDNFHTLMYTCAPEFQRLPWSYGVGLMKSLLLPLVLIALLLVFWNPTFHILAVLRKKLLFPRYQNALQLNDVVKLVEPAIVFNTCLLIAFFVLSMMAMRLKLFLTPQMCVLVSLIASKESVNSIQILREKKSLEYLTLLIIFCAIYLSGIDNIKRQRSIEGEYSNYPLEELLTWVQMKTKSSDVFAGPMPVMASILLSTGRPIVNHPYYEDEAMRNRTLLVYSLFSRKTPSEAFESIKRLGANFAVLEANKCFDHMQPRKGCKMTDLWDIEDPMNTKRPPLCPTLFSNDASPFERVFFNAEYVVLKVGLR
ncbi:probable C-mannosyltransferase DPY19L1 isoform X2 [Thrips palmi]|uniref:Probable C-mannosyltransferase DPY19L1 isoform X2 n=1 Tax=Thrips palmi TaxID=161013 RepID=A0A6P9ADJ9_THRPL|nr:probable C-mannosyltransferase DPY19L1 isoform X2 [Thrips palmi]